MGIYTKHILPPLIDWACRLRPSAKQREKVIPLAAGNVLEIGVGSGLNLPYYDSSRVTNLTAIDPEIRIWNQNKIDRKTLGFAFEFIETGAEAIPLDTNSVDCIVTTYTLCSIKDTDLAFEELRRVLKPGGRLIFNEHGKAPDASVHKWQNRLNPIWGRFSGGCSLNKDIPRLIQSAGFEFQSLDSMYIPGWRPAAFNYWGIASVR
jgi:ubiquinone/menaquinone biosynthesis C-methylase UbiE